MTKRRQDLLIELDDFEEKSYYAVYDNFQVDNEVGRYKLMSVGQYTGTAGR